MAFIRENYSLKSLKLVAFKSFRPGDESGRSLYTQNTKPFEKLKQHKIDVLIDVRPEIVD
jgi:hypothetical protein